MGKWGNGRSETRWESERKVERCQNRSEAMRQARTCQQQQIFNSWREQGYLLTGSLMEKLYTLIYQTGQTKIHIALRKSHDNFLFSCEMLKNFMELDTTTEVLVFIDILMPLWWKFHMMTSPQSNRMNMILLFIGSLISKDKPWLNVKRGNFH